MSRLAILLSLATFVCLACTSDDPREATEPGAQDPPSTTAAGADATASGPFNPETCVGVLGSPPTTHSLDVQALTESGQAGSPQIATMCAAVYETSSPGDPFLTVALIQFKSAEPAIAHYDLMRDVFDTQAGPDSVVDGADTGPLDSFSALTDSDGIGLTTVFRQDRWVLTVSVGPTVADSPWKTGDVQTIGESILERAQD